MIYNELLFLVVSNFEIMFQNLLLLFNNSKPNIMETPIVIENGKIFIESRETTNPTEIGYAIIDAIQEGFEITIKTPSDKIDVLFQNRDFPVYLKHDIDQLPRMIVSTVIEDSAIIYNLSCGAEITQNYSFEISRTKTIF